MPITCCHVEGAINGILTHETPYACCSTHGIAYCHTCFFKGFMNHEANRGFDHDICLEHLEDPDRLRPNEPWFVDSTAQPQVITTGKSK